MPKYIQKFNLSKLPCVLIGLEVLDRNPITRFFPDILILQNVWRPLVLLFSSKKSAHKSIIFVKTQKTSFLGHFLHFSGPPDPSECFFKNWAKSIFLYYNHLTSCKKSEKTVEWIVRYCVAKRRTEQSQIHRRLSLAPVSKNSYCYYHY